MLRYSVSVKRIEVNDILWEFVTLGPWLWTQFLKCPLCDGIKRCPVLSWLILQKRFELIVGKLFGIYNILYIMALGIYGGPGVLSGCP